MLRLRIVSDQRRSLAERSKREPFSVEGGTIGRSADNDWCLPDPSRYVSAHHARVQFREGHFYLQDVSTNGVYVNDDMEPLAKRGLERLPALRWRRYCAWATTTSSQPSSAAGAAGAAGAARRGGGRPDQHSRLRPSGRAPDGDIGASLDLHELLQPGQRYGSCCRRSMLRPSRSTPDGCARSPGPRMPSSCPSCWPPDALTAVVRAAHGAPRRGGRTRAEGRCQSDRARGRAYRTGRPSAAAPASSPSDCCGGAGAAAASRRPAVSRGAVGFKDLERSRSETRNRYRIESPPQEPDDPRPALATRWWRSC